MSIKDQLPDFSDLRPRLTVIGVGGAGCNAINNMITSGLVGVDFIVANTDAQALAASSTDLRIQLGATLTEGLGAGSRPEIGEAAAEEAIEEIRNRIRGSHMVFIAAGMGGGTGTGAASVIARVSRELGILTVGVVTKPFLFEGARRMRIAEVGVAELRGYVDTLIVIPNQNLFRVASEKTTFSEAFVMADQVLYSGVACIVDLIIKEGLINLDFADVRTVMSGMGTSLMGTGEATGERRATVAAEEAISNPLLDDVSLRGAKGLLLSITGGPDLTLYEVDEAASRVRQEVDPEANIIVGATYDETLGDRVRVSIVASGMSRAGEAERAPPAPAEDWARAVRSPPPQAGRQGYAEGARHASVAHAAPFDPQQDQRGARTGFAAPYQHAPSGPHELQRRLTEALQPAPQPPGYAASRPQMQPHDVPGGSRARTSPWVGPGNVRIEEGPPQLQGGAVPPPLPPGYGAPQAQPGFAPQPPSEVRRQSRRMPEPGDFSALGEHGYRAAGNVEDEPRVYAATPHPQREPRRRIGLFERITGRVRNATDSQPHRPANAHGYPQETRATQNAPLAGEGYDPYSERSESHERDSQDSELPVFFRERRK
jgi:cell division protein FtsZ